MSIAIGTIPDDLMEELEELKTVRRNQQRIKTGAGETTVEGVFLYHQIKGDSSNGYKSSKQYTPPKKIPMIKGANGSFPGKMTTMIKMLSVKPVPGSVEPRDDGRSGCKVKALLGFLPEAETWLKANYKAIYDGTYKGDGEPFKQWINENGELATHSWYQLSGGQEVKMKVDGSKDSPFRKMDSSRKFVIGRLTKLQFSKVGAHIFVGMRKPWDPNNKKNNKKKNGAKAEAATAAPAENNAGGGDGGGDAEPETFPAESLPAGVAAVAAPASGDGAAAASGTEELPYGYFRFECNGDAVMSDDVDPDLPDTEKLKLLEDRDSWRLIPFVQWKAMPARDRPNSVYFYLYDRYCTPGTGKGPNDEGIMMTVMDPEKGPNGLNDYMRTYQNENTPKLVLRFNLYQWRREPSKANQYSVVLNCWDDAWKCYGILDPALYTSIMPRHYDVPMHVYCNIWAKDTVKFDENYPSTKVDVNQDNPLRGMYSCISKDLSPDMIDYLGRRGIPLTMGRVKAEFRNWQGTAGGGSRTTMKLEQINADEGTNPLHTDKASSPVICLGNGQVSNAEEMAADPDVEPRATSHFFTGNVWPMFKTHNFYAITSHRLTDEENAKFAGVDPSSATDKFLNALIKKDSVFYVIYAVKKNLKLAGAAPIAKEPVEEEEEVDPEADYVPMDEGNADDDDAAGEEEEEEEDEEEAEEMEVEDEEEDDVDVDVEEEEEEEEPEPEPVAKKVRVGSAQKKKAAAAAAKKKKKAPTAGLAARKRPKKKAKGKSAK